MQYIPVFHQPVFLSIHISAIAHGKNSMVKEVLTATVSAIVYSIAVELHIVDDAREKRIIVLFEAVIPIAKSSSFVDDVCTVSKNCGLSTLYFIIYTAKAWQNILYNSNSQLLDYQQQNENFLLQKL